MSHLTVMYLYARRGEERGVRVTHASFFSCGSAGPTLLRVRSSKDRTPSAFTTTAPGVLAISLPAIGLRATAENLFEQEETHIAYGSKDCE